MKQFRRALFLFRRDVRLYDNTALNAAFTSADEVVPLYVLDTSDTAPECAQGIRARAFARVAVTQLAREIQRTGGVLVVRIGRVVDEVVRVVRETKSEAVFLNMDETLHARAVECALRDVLEPRGVSVHASLDATLAPVRDVRTRTGNSYQVFTPFLRNAQTLSVRNTHTARGMFARVSVKSDALSVDSMQCAPFLATRKAGVTQLRLVDRLGAYTETRNCVGEEGTSRLSPYLAHGLVSVREVYQRVQALPFDTSIFVSELYWRDFYRHIAWHFPYVFGAPFQSWASHIAWENDMNIFLRWSRGETGVPIVDAGIRELLSTGWMHNRARMIVASYLTKNLLVDWQWGEQFFAEHLVDYDPASNNGGWQWSASVGADPRPLRIFNPYTQTKRFDPLATYIRRWVPELGLLDARMLADGRERDLSEYAKNYPAPMVGQRESFYRARERYARARQMFRP